MFTDTFLILGETCYCFHVFVATVLKRVVISTAAVLCPEFGFGPIFNQALCQVFIIVAVTFILLCCVWAGFRCGMNEQNYSVGRVCRLGFV